MRGVSAAACEMVTPDTVEIYRKDHEVRLMMELSFLVGQS